MKGSALPFRKELLGVCGPRTRGRKTSQRRPGQRPRTWVKLDRGGRGRVGEERKVKPQKAHVEPCEGGRAPLKTGAEAGKSPRL